ncbi:MAG: DUF2067 family protein [Pyrobaculum sp.]
MLELSFKFHRREEVERFLILLERHLDTPYLVKTRLLHVYIQLEDKKEAELVKRLAALAKGGGKIPLLVLFRDTNLARPIPPEAIANALTLRGHTAEIKGDVLETDVSYDEVLKTAGEISRLYKEAERYPLTPHAKRVVTAYAHAKGLTIGKAIEELQRLGLLDKALRYEETLKFLRGGKMP